MAHAAHTNTHALQPGAYLVVLGVDVRAGFHQRQRTGFTAIGSCAMQRSQALSTQHTHAQIQPRTCPLSMSPFHCPSSPPPRHQSQTHRHTEIETHPQTETLIHTARREIQRYTQRHMQSIQAHERTRIHSGICTSLYIYIYIYIEPDTATKPCCMYACAHDNR